MLSKNKNRIDRQTISQIQQCYEGLGFKSEITGAGIPFYLSPYWRNSIMTPLFLSKPKINAKFLKDVENYFKKNKQRTPYSSKKPYLNLIEDSYFDRKSIRQQLTKSGWTYTPKSNLWLCLWRKPEPLFIPKGYSFRVGGYFDPKLRKDFSRIMKDNFKASQEFMEYLDKLHRKIEKNVKLVIIYNAKSTAVGGGLVATGKAGSYLYCGAIDKKYRQRGLWKLLVSARQSISTKNSENAWVMTTSVPHLARSCEWTRKVSIVVKNPAL